MWYSAIEAVNFILKCACCSIIIVFVCVLIGERIATWAALFYFYELKQPYSFKKLLIKRQFIIICIFALHFFPILIVNIYIVCLSLRSRSHLQSHLQSLRFSNKQIYAQLNSTENINWNWNRCMACAPILRIAVYSYSSSGRPQFPQNHFTNRNRESIDFHLLSKITHFVVVVAVIFVIAHTHKNCRQNKIIWL